MRKSKRTSLVAVLVLTLLFGGFNFGTATETADAAVNTTYYVDSINGNDGNSGTSESTPWKSLEKVSVTTFLPGDRILFKAGSVWTGRLEPKGSGAEGAPIKISTYGTGAKPVLMPGPDWVEPTMTMNNYVKRNVPVNSVIKLYNQSYWEIDGLELFDPKHETIDPMTTNVYRRGIYIQAQDVGAVKHIYIRNVHINGFKGPDTNEGKVSGGIIYHVQYNPEVPSLRQPTWFEDIVVSDSTIENISRTGIKFHSSWCTRLPSADGKFPNVDFLGIGAWTPSVNIHIYNNVIHDIGGDGIILRDTQDAVVEHNIVYRAALDGTYAVGIFNWNSNNTTIQYNEVYDTKPAGDAQGIEIDALNDLTYVQYNYVHNNAGGFAMWCNTDTLPSYDGIYRYNISQNDSTSHGLIQPRASMKGAMFYNNTVYMGPGESRQFINNFSGGPDHQVQVFNNIFYNEGTLSNLSFSTNALNYKSNVYYGFPSVPNTDLTAITADPKLVAPGTGSNGWNTVGGYKLQEDSPAINAGLFIANNGGEDYWGNALYNGAPDIGANEFTDVQFPPAEPQATNQIPQSQMTAVASSQQPSEPAQRVLDDNTGTVWHTKWDLSNPLPQSITLQLGETSIIESIQYVPRQDGNTNGNITGYNVQVSTDGVNFTEVASGTWLNNSTRKTAAFEPISAAYVKLVATSGVGGWASASEINVFRSADALEPELESISFENDNYELKVNEAVTVQVNGSYADSTNKEVTEWADITVANPAVVSIEEGRLIGLSVGETVITATYKEKQTTATVKVSEEVDPHAPSTTLSGDVGSVVPGQTFTVKYGVVGVENVAAQDIMIEYDSAIMEYVAGSISSVREGVMILNEPDISSPGKLRVIVASQGANHSVNGNAPILELTFKAKDVSQSVSGDISLSNAVFGNSEGQEVSAALALLTILITAEANSDVNHDGKVSLGDLAIIAANYGKDAASADWNAIKHLDLDGSGMIDITDLVIVAKQL